MKQYIFFITILFFINCFSQPAKYSLNLNLKKGDNFEFSCSSEEILNSKSGMALRRIDNDAILFARELVDSLEIKRVFNYEIAFEVLQTNNDTISLNVTFKNIHFDLITNIPDKADNDLRKVLDPKTYRLALKKITDTPFNIKLLKNGQIAYVDDVLEKLDTIKNIKEDSKDFYYNQMEKSFNKNAYSNFFVNFPKHSISINEEWKTKETIKIGEKEFTFHYKNILKEVTSDYYLVEVKSVFEDKLDEEFMDYESQYVKINANINNVLYIDKKSGVIKNANFHTESDIDSGYFNSYSETYLDGIAFKWTTVFNFIIEQSN